MLQSFFKPNYIFNNDAYFLDFRAQKFLLIFFNVNPFYHQQVRHFGVRNYEKQHTEGTCKVSGRSIVYLAFYADFCLCPKLVIITTLRQHYTLHSTFITSDFASRVPSQNIPKLLHCRTRRIGPSCKTVDYSHMISLNIHTVYNKVKNGFGRRGYHCVSQHPSIDAWH